MSAVILAFPVDRRRPAPLHRDELEQGERSACGLVAARLRHEVSAAAVEHAQTHAVNLLRDWPGTPVSSAVEMAVGAALRDFDFPTDDGPQAA